VASLVGIPLEIDKNNVKRWEYVRAKIGCRDITKVPATVEGLLDLHFHGFTFQREVPVEWSSSTTWNTWTRNTDRPSDDNSFSKKAKKEDENKFQKGSTSQSHGDGEYSSQEHGKRHGKQPNEKEPMDLVMEEDGQNHKQIDTENDNSQKVDNTLMEEEREEGKDTSEEDNEDSGPCFDDIISPGGTHLNFGDFQNMELKKIFKIKINERTVAVNRYGTNLIKKMILWQ
jgi:hypothetical protein